MGCRLKFFSKRVQILHFVQYQFLRIMHLHAFKITTQQDSLILELPLNFNLQMNMLPEFNSVLKQVAVTVGSGLVQHHLVD